MKPKDEITAHEGKEVSIKDLHILVAEDNELNMEIAKELLEERGAVVTAVSNGEEALHTFGNQPAGTFDVILMDIMMPVMDGLEATREIRNLKREDAATIAIIALTANAFFEDVEKCQQAGMNAHVAKPIDFDKLAKTIIGLLRQE